MRHMEFELLLFYTFALLSFISAVMVIASKNPVHSVLFLILVFLNAAGFLLLLQVEFLALLFLIVYVGAIAVLFLFVVMMLNIKILDENISRYLPIGGLIVLMFMSEILLIVRGDLVSSVGSVDFQIGNWSGNIAALHNIEVIGLLLYTHYFALFLVASMILLVAMIGAIVLTMHPRRGLKRQDEFRVSSRSFENTISRMV